MPFATPSTAVATAGPLPFRCAAPSRRGNRPAHVPMLAVLEPRRKLDFRPAMGLSAAAVPADRPLSDLEAGIAA